MKKTPDKDLLPEYAFSGGVRGKDAARVAKGINIVVLDKDVQRRFHDSVAVNAALRALAEAVAVTHRGGRPKAARKRAA